MRRLRRGPASTPELARGLSANAVFLRLRELEALGVVRRFAPVARGPGRPAARWALCVSCARAESVEDYGFPGAKEAA